MARAPKHKRTAAQAAAAKKWAASGRASQARRRASEKAHHQPTRTAKQMQASLKWAAAGRASQKRARSGLKPLPTHKRAAAGGLAACLPVTGPFRMLAQANADWPCCAATAVAAHLYAITGIVASQADIMNLHEAAGGEDGALIPELLEIAGSGFAGARVARFWPVSELNLPGTIAGLRLPGGTHAVLLTSRTACVSWGSVLRLPAAEEAWWAEWE